MDSQNIRPDKFRFVQMDRRLYDGKFETKPIGYFRDAWLRFKKNRSSVAAFIIIMLIFVWALVAPLFSPLRVSDVDAVYSRVTPKLPLFEGSGFWDGGTNMTANLRQFVYINSIGIGAMGHSGGPVTWSDGAGSRYNPVISSGGDFDRAGKSLRNIRVDTYHMPGFRYITLPSMEAFDKIKAWEKETGLPVIFPMIDVRSRYMSSFNATDANFWYRHADNMDPLDSAGRPMNDLDRIMENGLVDNYLRDGNGNVMYYAVADASMLSVRVLYYNYYHFLHGRDPLFVFGADGMGYDILVRLASGILLSLALGIGVFVINFVIGAFLGAFQGYFGGVLDILFQRFTEIISNIPFIILNTLIVAHFVNRGGVSPFWGLVLAFVVSGWIGTANLVRVQFYRFKNQEYILAARTLGANDFRLMFKHIFPNAIGTIITASVLSIPGVVFMESVLSFLGIINLDSANTTSLGTMLSNGRVALSQSPHILFFPAVVISLLMISFNLFGNGLRDAFNPSLRGTES
jgi:oligopeptide transport system permease protein